MTERPRRKRKGPKPRWCVIAWMIRLPGKPHVLPFPYEDRVKPLIRKVDTIFAACDVRFKVCKIIPLDAAQVKIGNKSLAGLFADDGSITLSDTVRPSVFLQEFATQGTDADFNTEMTKKCLHLFFVHEIKNQGSNVSDRGSGGWYGADTARTSFAMVGVKGVDTLATQDALAQAIAHEFGHALGLSPNDAHSTVEDNLMKPFLQPDDLKFNDGNQCETIRATLAQHITDECP